MVRLILHRGPMRPLYLTAVCLFSLFGGIGGQYLFGASGDANNCPVTRLTTGHPAGAPTVSDNHWYPNDDRTIWVTFGVSGLRSELGEPVDPVTRKASGDKALWYKPSHSLMTVTGRRIDGRAAPLVYKLSGSGPIERSEIDFPTAGCWEIEAKASTADLRLVVLVKTGPLPTLFP
jgi:hypothetical protein